MNHDTYILKQIAELDPLTETTWVSWKWHVEGLLDSTGVWNTVLRKDAAGNYPTRPVAAGAAPTPAEIAAQQEFDTARRKATSWIRTAAGIEHRELSEPHRATSDVTAIWDALVTRYEHQDGGGRFKAISNLFTVVAKPGELWNSVTKRLDAAGYHFMSLLPPGYTVLDIVKELKLFSLLNLLPKAHTLRTTLLVNPNIDYPTAVSAIERFEVVTAAGSSAESASKAYSPQSTSGKQCTFCTYRGHTIVECKFAETYSKLFHAERVKGVRRSGTDGQVIQQGSNSGQTNWKKRSNIQARAVEDEQTEEFAGNARTSSPLSQISADSWTIDSGASKHMTFRRDWLKGFVSDRRPVKLADGNVIYTAGRGFVEFHPDSKGVLGPAIRLDYVLYVPDLDSNLISINFLTKFKEYSVHFYATSVDFARRGRTVFTASISSNSIAHLDGQVVTDEAAASAISSRSPASLQVWHDRTGHRHFPLLVKMKGSDTVKGFDVTPGSRVPALCEECIESKSHRAPHTTPAVRATRPLERVSSDIHGPIETASRKGYRYWLIFTDQYSGFTAVYFIRRKSETFDCFKKWLAWAELQNGHKLAHFRDDKGGEYISEEMIEYMENRGIQREHTIKDSPQQNGQAERYNQTMQQGVTAMIAKARLPPSSWVDSAATFVHLNNRVPSQSRGFKSPHELFYGKIPSISHLRTWGCLAFVHLQKDQRQGSFGPRAKRCIFLRYAAESKGWVFWDTEKRVEVISDSATFVESVFPGTLTGKIARLSDGSYPETIPNPPSIPVEPNAAAIPLPPSPPPSRPPTPDPPLPEAPADPDPPVEDDNTPPSPGHGGDAAPERLILRIPGREERELMRRREVAALPREVRNLMSNFEHHPLNSSAGDSNVPDPSNDADTGYITELADLSSTPHEAERDPGHTVSSALVSQHTIFRRLDPSEFHDSIQNDVTIALENAVDLALLVSSAIEPNSLKDAQLRPDADQYINAAIEEIDSHLKNRTWNLVKLPAGRKAIGCRWVFKVKRDSEGKVERYKARLVAKGFAQREGVDYKDTFAPTARFAALRTVIALAAEEDMELESIDVSTAFLNGDIDAEVFMDIPEGLEVEADDNHKWVLQLLKGLYGIKQGPRIWSRKLHKELCDMGFTRLECDHSVFIYERNKVKLVIPVHVDDLIIASKSKDALKEFKLEFSKRFKLREQGPTTFFLGVKLERDRANRTISLSQPTYIQSIIDEYIRIGPDGAFNSVLTPMLENADLSEKQCPEKDDEEEIKRMAQFPYRQAVGKLLYLSIATRPDISYAVGVLCRFLTNPGKEHWAAVKHLLRYLKGTKHLKLVYSPAERTHPFVTFSDADHGGHRDNKRSTAGFVSLVAGAAVHWSSRIQHSVALSSTEAEYMSASAACQEIMWLRYFFEETGYGVSEPSPLFMDSASALQVAKNPEHQSTMKHVHRNYHWVREHVEAGDIIIHHIPGTENVADIFTKALGKNKFLYLRPLLGLRF
jgi:transposase InsO family protein